MPTKTATPQDQQSSDSRPVQPRGRAADPQWALAPYTPDARRPWHLRWAGHLFRRAAFGATWDDLQRAVAAGPQRTIDRLLHPADDVAAFQQACDENEAGTDNLETARAWWLRRMLLTPYPLLEKLTLFWHGHFAASIDKVGRASLMVQQIQLLRRHALGRFDAMLLAVARNPAMLLWLDAAANRKARGPGRAAGAERFWKRIPWGPAFVRRRTSARRSGPLADCSSSRASRGRSIASTTRARKKSWATAAISAATTCSVLPLAARKRRDGSSLSSTAG